MALYLDRLIDRITPAAPSAVVVTGDPSAPALSAIVTRDCLLTGVVVVDDAAGAGSEQTGVEPVDGVEECGVVVLPGQAQVGPENSGE